MKIALLFFVYFVFIVDVDAQTKSKNVNEDAVYTTYNSVEVMPVFPGGMEKFYTYLFKNIKYSDTAFNSVPPKRILIKFIIEKNGGITRAQIISPQNKTLDKEILRVFKNSPSWIAGTQNGKKVRVEMIIPLIVEISD